MDFLTPPSLVTTNFPELLTIFAAALGCGLLIGLERERSKKNGQPHHFAGVRTFGICSLLGAICFLFGTPLAIVGALIVGGIGLFSLKNQTEDDPGATTEFAFVMTYFIGALCLCNIPLAAGLSVILTGLLMTKHTMHGIVSQWITEAELRDGLFLLALVLIALPLTPNSALWGNVLNPYVILKIIDFNFKCAGFGTYRQTLTLKQQCAHAICDCFRLCIKHCDHRQFRYGSTCGSW